MSKTPSSVTSRTPLRTRRSGFTTLGACVSAFILLPASVEGRSVGADQIVVETRAKPVITSRGHRFRDLNSNGRLDPYEDWRLSDSHRVADLISRMSLEEKAAMMVHDGIPVKGPPFAAREYDLINAEDLIARGVNSMITRISTDPANFAIQNNAVQAMAERTRLGIPLTISTDPRSHFGGIFGASSAAGAFSQWPEASGLAAIGDPVVTRSFADIVRQEYRAVGIQQSLAPQADLATEPRWSRIYGTFGEDPDRVSAMVSAYVTGMQGSARGLARNGVLTIVKHWVGYGAQTEGFDSHSIYGRTAQLSNATLDLHIKPFKAAFRARAGGVMPTYSILQGITLNGRAFDPVGGGFSRQLVGELLRGRFAYDGIVLSDWEITRDCTGTCLGGWRQGTPPSVGMPWGMENATIEDRYVAAINAGVDQLGGVSDAQPILAALQSGRISISRIDDAVRRLLAPKFRMGLFDNPYVDPARAVSIVGNASFRAKGDAAQRRSMVVLKAERWPALQVGMKVYLVGLSPLAAKSRGLVLATSPAEADVAIVRTATPFQRLHPDFFFGSFQNEGDLDFKPGNEALAKIVTASAKVPTIVSVDLDRPAILSGVEPLATVLLGTFGATDDAVLDVLLGKSHAGGRLPFELPRSMEAVLKQASDQPHDSQNPLFPIYAGGADSRNNQSPER